MHESRNLGIIGLLYFDCLIHSTLIFGWSSISVILTSQGFYSQSSQSPNATEQCSTGSGGSEGGGDPLSQILVMSTGLLGIFLLVFGLIRDFVAYGLCRLLCYCFLVASYTMMLLATPGETDYLQFSWVLHYAAGIGIFLNSMQFFGIYPAYVGTLTGVCNSLLAICSLIPQLWLTVVVKWQLVSYETVLSVWLAASVVSMLVGLFIVPWNNMPQDVSTATNDDFATLFQIVKAKKPIIKQSESFVKQLKGSAALLKSPILVVHVIMFASGNCTTTLSLNFVNRIMCSAVGTDQFGPLQSRFELIRATGDFLLCPMIGFMADKSMVYWTKRNGAHDVQKTLVPYTMIFVANIVFMVGLLGLQSLGIWPFLIGLTLCMGQIYMFETIGCSINFPADAQGVIFALVELIGALFAFIQIPIIKLVDAGDSYQPYIYFEMAMFALIIACLPVLLLIGNENAFLLILLHFKVTKNHRHGWKNWINSVLIS